MEELLKKDAILFRAFCDVNRLRIIKLLIKEQHCNCELNDILGLGQSALSYHIKILIEAGVVEVRKEGKWRYYQVRVDALKLATKRLEILFDNQEAI